VFALVVNETKLSKKKKGEKESAESNTLCFSAIFDPMLAPFVFSPQRFLLFSIV